MTPSFIIALVQRAVATLDSAQSLALLLWGPDRWSLDRFAWPRMQTRPPSHVYTLAA